MKKTKTLDFTLYVKDKVIKCGAKRLYTAIGCSQTSAVIFSRSKVLYQSKSALCVVVYKSSAKNGSHLARIIKEDGKKEDVLISELISQNTELNEEEKKKIDEFYENFINKKKPKTSSNTSGVNLLVKTREKGKVEVKREKKRKNPPSTRQSSRRKKVTKENEQIQTISSSEEEVEEPPKQQKKKKSVNIEEIKENAVLKSENIDLKHKVEVLETKLHDKEEEVENLKKDKAQFFHLLQNKNNN